MAEQLPNYLKMYRRRAGLSQEELAFLLGATAGSGVVSRYENGSRFPSLETILALEMVLNAPVTKLYEAHVRQVEPIISQRACQLLEEIESARSVVSDLGLKTLQALASRVGDEFL